jgi:hypothetical protein
MSIGRETRHRTGYAAGMTAFPRIYADPAHGMIVAFTPDGDG